MKKTQVVIVGLYTYINVAPRILHPLVDRIGWRESTYYILQKL
jgi:hypothetical protein